jgi:hypothetical protein
VLWRKSPAIKAVVAVSFALLMATGFLTRSFGFLVGLLAMTLVWLFLHRRRVLWNRLSIVLILLTVSGAAFYSARRVVIAGANPVILRFANWISAWSVFSMNPLGSGLNTFGIVYPRYMLSGANETQCGKPPGTPISSDGRGRPYATPCGDRRVLFPNLRCLSLSRDDRGRALTIP